MTTYEAMVQAGKDFAAALAARDLAAEELYRLADHDALGGYYPDNKTFAISARCLNVEGAPDRTIRRNVRGRDVVEALKAAATDPGLAVIRAYPESF